MLSDWLLEMVKSYNILRCAALRKATMTSDRIFDDVLIVEYRMESNTPEITWRYLTDEACANNDDRATPNNHLDIPYGIADICCPSLGKGYNQKRYVP